MSISVHLLVNLHTAVVGVALSHAPKSHALQSYKQPGPHLSQGRGSPVPHGREFHVGVCQASPEGSQRVQALQPLDAILRRHSGAVLAVAVAKALLEKLLPDAARTVRMWRMFLPIWARCRWTKWRAQEAKGCSKAQVHTHPRSCLLLFSSHCRGSIVNHAVTQSYWQHAICIC